MDGCNNARDIAVIALCVGLVAFIVAFFVFYPPESAPDAPHTAYTSEAVLELDQRLKAAEDALEDARELLARERE